MLEEKLKKIYEQQQANNLLYSEQFLPEIDQVLRTENPKMALLHLQKRLIGTPYESALSKIDDLTDARNISRTILAQQLTSIFTQTIRENNIKQAHEVDLQLASMPIAKLTPSALFYATAIYNQQEDLASLNKAQDYSNRALELAQKKTGLALSQRIREQYAYTFDRLQLSQLSPRPQRYGTCYSSKNELLAPSKDYQYDRFQLNKARRELKIGSLEEQERRKGIILKQPQLIPMPSKKKEDEKEKEAKLRPKCGKCGKTGHPTGMCINKP